MYYLESLQYQTVKFIKLTQGNMTMIWYEAKFKELSHIALALNLVNTKATKARRFERGSRLESRLIYGQ